MASMQLYLAVAFGGAIGACLRLFIQQSFTNMLGKGFPFGTLAVNVIGSFIIGLVYALIQQQAIENPVLKSFLTVGILGALTTFSTFSLETLVMLQDGDLLKAGLNILLNLCLCICCVWLALQIMKG
ncbi:fluoride efflux transporter CrcB [Glaciecola sp. 1036]|uniref:fluoride efflux transporter CrcB n=1 Tax=Alteromonadaceae TaxID=72275 RepID=UPI003D00EE5D